MNNSELSALLKDMSLDEKIEQLIQLHGGFFGEVGTITGPAAEFKMTGDQPYRTGSVLGEAGAKRLRELQDKMTAAQPHHIPALFMADVIHGYKTAFPVPIAIGSSFNTELAEKIAEAAAKECSAAGVHVTFSPMVDVSRDARWGRCMESPGEDPYLNSEMAKAEVKGFQGDDVKKPGRVAACAKHFAAYGAPVAGRDYNVTEISEHTLYEDYLKPYRAAVEAGVKLVMTAFNTIDRKPCTTNKRLLRGILRDDMGFDGVVISDYNAVGETVIHGSSYDKRDAAVKALSAGCDIDMMSDCYLSGLRAAVQSGELDESLIDEAVMRVLKLKNDLGLFENPYKDGSEEAEREIIFSKEIQELGRKAAVETAVLLKNNGVLPLSISQKIAVVGELCDSPMIVGSWSIFADRSRTVTLKKALETLCPECDIKFFPSDNADEASEYAKGCDAVIVCVGENEEHTGESMSKADISLSEAHNRLVEAVSGVNKNVVTLVFGGRPLGIARADSLSAAVLEVWLPGTVGCLGIADILFGRENPSGRLSMSLPYCSGQLPITYAMYKTGRPKPENTGFIRYMSNYMDVPNRPLYSFGQGLGYSEIEYSAVRLDKDVIGRGESARASVTLKNLGERDQLEAVQLYIRDEKSSVVRPTRELKGFKKVLVPAGGEVEVGFIITERELEFYGEDMRLCAEPGDFKVFVTRDSLGENCATLRLEGG